MWAYLLIYLIEKRKCDSTFAAMTLASVTTSRAIVFALFLASIFDFSASRCILFLSAVSDTISCPSYAIRKKTNRVKLTIKYIVENL